MKSGKFDEELSRMSSIVDRITPKSMLLLNESFAATNEREGSQIAGEVVRALLDSGIKVLYVTHLYELADGLYQEGRGDALFLKAERKPGGDRTFRIREGMPMPTSYAQDLYRRIFVGASDSEHPGGPSVAGLVDSATGQV